MLSNYPIGDKGGKGSNDCFVDKVISIFVPDGLARQEIAKIALIISTPIFFAF